MIEIELTVTSWQLCYEIFSELGESEKSPIPLGSRRWISGTATARKKTRHHSSSIPDTIVNALEVSWSIYPNRKVGSNGIELSTETLEDRAIEPLGIAEIFDYGGDVMIVAVGSSNFDWIVRSFEADKVGLKRIALTAEDRGGRRLQLTRMSLGGAERWQ